ncbi:squamous cell carcinoma antigen recognized by T-cells 3 [Diachasma alloeum]|uniref:squamous cell carcinoma antigen recognized by T-cells 3 n=1 Tax=Diachasma alloeum TaxID=454923 RepID=UPI0007384744|nr:squamous cell carcinoma antigen recognized by T-cells 3 [Diachasma alloeum]
MEDEGMELSAEGIEINEKVDVVSGFLEGDEEGDSLVAPEGEECDLGDDDEDEDDDDDADEAEVKQLEGVLAENPYDYASHVAVITKLQMMGDLERLRIARERMSDKYPLSPELWLAWLRDEMKLAVSEGERRAVEELCERAVKDYLSVEVWLEYLQFNIGSMGSDKNTTDKVRQLFERALTAAGLHFTKGAIIWEAFREFENVLVSLASNDSEKKEQLDRVGALFRRQLGCPLLGMEKTWDEFSAWRSDEGKEATMDDNTTAIIYKRALDISIPRIPFEEKLLSSQNEIELLDVYKAYLLYEKQHGDPGRVTVLYERAITELSLEWQLWLDYLEYVESKIKMETVVSPIYERATRNVPWISKIWIKWLRSLEKWEKPLLEVQRILELALIAGFSSADDCRNVWMTYLEYLRRRADPDSPEKEKQLEVLERAFNKACEHLAKSFGLDGDPQCVVLQFWARTEAIHAGNMDRSRSLWSDILSQGHSERAASWLEYITLEKCYGDTKHLRKLYQKALAAVKDWPESIANSWIDFERDEGTLEQMEICEAKSKERLAKIAEERGKVQDQGEGSSGYGKKEMVKKGKRRHEEVGGKWENLGVTPRKQNKVERAPGKVPPRVEKNREKVEEKSERKGTPPPGFKPPPGEESMDTSQDIDDKISIFVSNLDYATSEEEVREALSPVEPISLVKMITDYKGRSKGFCYVTLSSSNAVEDALKLDRTPINGRPMFISRCDPNKTTRGNAFKYASILEKNKLFVKGLPVKTTKEDLETIFKAYGPLKDVRIVTYRNGHSKGLAYVEFEDENAASKAVLATDGLTIDDKVISVAISKPPERKKNPEEPLIKSLGGTTTSRTHFGVPKTLLSMIPRNVKPAANGITAGKTDAKPLNNQDFRNMLLNKKS